MVDVQESAPVFAALGDPTRLALLSRLWEGPESITRLTAGAGMSRQAITRHLHVLSDAGLVTGTRSGRELIWQANPDGIRGVQRYLEEISRGWDASLGRLKAYMESKQKDVEAPMETWAL